MTDEEAIKALDEKGSPFAGREAQEVIANGLPKHIQDELDKLNDKPITFTPSLFFQHATCPHWVWYDRCADPALKGDVPELTQKLLEEGVLHEEQYIQGLDLEAVEEINPEEAFEHTMKLMKEGAELIYQGEIQISRAGVLYRGRPDLLEKKAGNSTLGDYYYAPVEIKSSKSVHKEHVMQLCLYSMILKQLQGVFPEEVAIINKDHERQEVEITEEVKENTENKIEEILEILKGKKPALALKSTCKNTPWSDLCKKSAEEADDMCLLYHEHLRSQGHKRLRSLGINTIEDILKMDIESLPRIPYNSPEVLERAKLQAQALRDGELKWLEPPDFPEEPLRFFFDIEGDPLLNVQYLFGFWVAGDTDRKYAKIGKLVEYPDEDRYFLYFLAEQPEDERSMWQLFLDWCELLPADGYRVYHYADYEKTYTRKLSEEYGSSAAFKNFYHHYTDLLRVVKTSVIFPLYFYSIKDLAKSKFLNYQWRHAKAGGAQSIFWYEKWLETKDPKILQDVIDYNEDDVRATERLYDWLVEKKA